MQATKSALQLNPSARCSTSSRNGKHKQVNKSTLLREFRIMALYKGLMHSGWPVTDVEKHFHDYDETWMVLGGHGVAYWIDHNNNREEFVLEEGDVWLIPAGYEHGSDGPNSPDFKLT